MNEGKKQDQARIVSAILRHKEKERKGDTGKNRAIRRKERRKDRIRQTQ